MEVIVLFYMAISFFIGWAIFSPFAEVEDLREWSFSRIETADLFAVFLPFSFFLSMILWTIPKESQTVPMVVVAIIGISILALVGFFVALFLLAKMAKTSPAKRMALIGIVMPLGSTLTLAWVVLPLVALANSILYAIPATFGIAIATLVLRLLSDWVCRNNSMA